MWNTRCQGPLIWRSGAELSDYCFSCYLVLVFFDIVSLCDQVYRCISVQEEFIGPISAVVSFASFFDVKFEFGGLIVEKIGTSMLRMNTQTTMARSLVKAFSNSLMYVVAGIATGAWRISTWYCTSRHHQLHKTTNNNSCNASMCQNWPRIKHDQTIFLFSFPYFPGLYLFTKETPEARARESFSARRVIGSFFPPSTKPSWFAHLGRSSNVQSPLTTRTRKKNARLQ